MQIRAMFFPPVFTVIEKEKKQYEEDVKNNNSSSTTEKNVNSMQTTLKCCLWNETAAEDMKIKSCYEKWGEFSVL